MSVGGVAANGSSSPGPTPSKEESLSPSPVQGRLTLPPLAATPVAHDSIARAATEEEEEAPS